MSTAPIEDENTTLSPPFDTQGQIGNAVEWNSP